jgi:hypothetical protein
VLRSRPMTQLAFHAAEPSAAIMELWLPLRRLPPDLF